MSPDAPPVNSWLDVARRHAGICLLLSCALIVLVLWTLQLTPYLNVANDSGRYMVLGESLARTGDLRLINDVRQPLDTLYPPGFPAIIAFWLRVTGWEPAHVVLLVKLTQLALLLGTFPLLYRLLARAGLRFRYIAAALLLAACCPALVSYANDVMSEMPLLFLCLASVVCVENAEGERKRRGDKEKKRQGEEERPEASSQKSVEQTLFASEGRLAEGHSDGCFQHPANAPNWEPSLSPHPIPYTLHPFLKLLALACAAGAFMMRTSGIAILLAQMVWFWRRFGWKWGLAATLVTLVVVGGWLRRNSHIIKAHPEIHYSTYVDQFTLRNPMKADAGRIPLNVKGMLSRMKFGFPTYVGLIPRALLHMMAAPGSIWLGLFYVLAVPITLLMFAGLWEAWRIGLKLSAGFAALFWFVAAMWPWQNARFLVPLLPFMLLFLALGTRTASSLLRRKIGGQAVHALQMAGAVLLLVYFANVHWRLIRQDHRPAYPGYAFGRSRDEAGFYAACDWLKHNTAPSEIVMGKPQYLLHLYSGNYTAQLEPTTSPRSLERAYILPQHVRYLLQDAWTWGVPRSRDIFRPYLRDYGNEWELAWEDPRGSGVRIWRRKSLAAPSPETQGK